MNPMPKHVAIILDGNGRWAQRKFMPRVAGHVRGKKTLEKITELCIKKKIPVLTVYAFSSENWRRPKSEVDFLMTLFKETLEKDLDRLHEEGICLKIIGDRERLSEVMCQLIDVAEAKTANNKALQLNVAINYGARADIVSSVKSLVQKVQLGTLSLEAIDEKIFGESLSLGGLPAPDLLIRTSGEHRLSNFLLWEMAYTELYFTPIAWPDFNEQAFDEAIESYQLRNRRFGGYKEKTVGDARC